MSNTMNKTKRMPKREDQFAQFIAAYFDRLWANPTYLGFMGKNLRELFELRKQFNHTFETLWGLLNLPNQNMQQRTLHLLNTLTSEWRFEQEETDARLSHLEEDLAEIKRDLKQLLNASKEKQNA